MRDVAEQVGITERAVQRIIRDLVEGGYLTRHRQGRHNVYAMSARCPLRHPLEAGTELQTLLEVLHVSATVSSRGQLPHSDQRGTDC